MEIRRYSIRYTYDYGVFLGTYNESWTTAKSAAVIDDIDYESAIQKFIRQTESDKIKNIKINSIHRLDDGLGIDEEEEEILSELNKKFKQTNGKW